MLLGIKGAHDIMSTTLVSLLLTFLLDLGSNYNLFLIRWVLQAENPRGQKPSVFFAHKNWEVCKFPVAMGSCFYPMNVFIV